MRPFLRALAISIAIAALIDPPVTTASRTHPRLAIVVADSASLALPSADGTTRRAAAEHVRARLLRDLSGAYDIAPRLTPDADAAIVIGDRYPASGPRNSEEAADANLWTVPVCAGCPAASAFPRLIATVTVGGSGDLSPNVRIERVDVPRDVPTATSVHVVADIDAFAMNGRSSVLTIGIGGIDTVRLEHRWTTARERWSAEADVVPVGEPPFVVHVNVPPADVERTAADNAADSVVDLRREPFRVFVYEPRPSWATTFVRRALEADPRFHVEARTMVAGTAGAAPRAAIGAPASTAPLNPDPRDRRTPVATTTPDMPSLSDASALDAFDVAIIGGVERLTTIDARALERFVRERGGTAVLAPDARADSEGVRLLLPGVVFDERVLDRPDTLAVVAPLAPIRASELLLARPIDVPGFAVVASLPGANRSPIVFTMPSGAGRVAFSGALDAWRYRTLDHASFDRFWQSTVAGLAIAAFPPIDVGLAPAILTPAERGEVIVRVHAGADASARPAANGREARATMTASAATGHPIDSMSATVDGRPIRLWPTAEAGVLRGTFTAPGSPGRYPVVVQARATRPISAARSLVVVDTVARTFTSRQAPLAMLATSRGGVDVDVDRLPVLESFVRTSIPAGSAPTTHHPMRSRWWALPFAACLGGEWFLRRRRGLR